MEPHERLNEAMNRRRLELRRHWKQIAADAGIATESLSAIRRGDYRPSELTAQGLDDALGWEAGSVYDIYDRGLPPRIRGRSADQAERPDRAQHAGSQASLDLDAYVGQTPLEKFLLDILRSDHDARRALDEDLQQQLRALNDKVDRLSPPKPQQEPGQDDERQLGA